MARKRELDECPECGAEFRWGRLACPECGSDAETGWKDAAEIEYQSVEIPETYEELVAGGGKPRSSRAVLYLVAAILALIAMLLLSVLAR